MTTQDSTLAFPYALTRAGVIMTPEPGAALEAEGVLNPASGRGPDGELYLLPRLVAEGNVSRVGIARVLLDGDMPVGVERQGVVLEPDRPFERGRRNSGVEDPRVTFLPALGLHMMTYVAYGPLGPRTAVAVSENLRDWRRLGPVAYEYDDGLGVDLSLFHNKDTVFFPEPVTAPDGTPSLAVLHRPVWDLGDVREGEGAHPPAGMDPRPSIWIAFIPLEAALADVRELARWRQNRFLAGPEHAFEALKIGAGPAPIRVPEGWLLLHHGVTGRLESGVDQQQNVNYAAGAMILDADEPWRVLQRSPEPLLAAETDDERSGIVPNVVFPTAIETVGDTHWVFYGMADSKIGVARLDRVAATG